MWLEKTVYHQIPKRSVLMDFWSFHTPRKRVWLKDFVPVPMPHSTTIQFYLDISLDDLSNILILEFIDLRKSR